MVLYHQKKIDFWIILLYTLCNSSTLIPCSTIMLYSSFHLYKVWTAYAYFMTTYFLLFYIKMGPWSLLNKIELQIIVNTMDTWGTGKTIYNCNTVQKWSVVGISEPQEDIRWIQCVLSALWSWYFTTFPTIIWLHLLRKSWNLHFIYKRWRLLFFQKRWITIITETLFDFLSNWLLYPRLYQSNIDEVRAVFMGKLFLFQRK